MERNIDKSLTFWSKKKRRKPLLLRGPRQTGKTFAVRKLGLSFKYFIEINFELEPQFCKLFEKDLVIERLLREIGALRNIKIVPCETLLFFDEIQVCPQAVLALRYFYETKQELHVIGAGSLLEFELHNLSVPVGRIEFMYVRPFTFIEFLKAAQRGMLADEIEHCVSSRIVLNQVLHEDAIAALREYLFVGGMPGVIQAFLESKSFAAAENEQRDIVLTYRADFAKYTGRTGIERVENVFTAIPSMVGEKTVFSRIDPESRAFQIKGAVDLLAMARIINKVNQTSGAGMPLTASVSEKHYKCIFLDVGLMQRVQNVHFDEWQQSRTLVDHHRGSIAEQFVGQEILHRQGDHDDPGLFFWHRTTRGSHAEVDYLYESNGSAIPIEVKSGATGHLRSMHQYFQAFTSVSGGIKCSLDQMSFTGKILNVPLYAVEYIPIFIDFLKKNESL